MRGWGGRGIGRGIFVVRRSTPYGALWWCVAIASCGVSLASFALKPSEHEEPQQHGLLSPQFSLLARGGGGWKMILYGMCWCAEKLIVVFVNVLNRCLSIIAWIY